MAHHDIDALIARGEREGVISPEQGDRLRAMAGESLGEALAPAGERPEAARSFNSVTVAYGVGALLVVFASGWFLFDRWSRLGARGVLTVAAVYATILVLLAVWLGRRNFPTASALCVMLAVAMTPLATWACLDLAGRWPSPNRYAGRVYWDGSWEAWQWIVIELATILVALIVLRARRVAMVTYPIAVALWGLQFHLGRIARGELWSADYDRWVLFTCGVSILVVADFVERWQRRAREQPASDRGDFASAFWFVGFVAFTIGYASLFDSGGNWRHLLLPIALGVLFISLYLRRRVVMAFGMLGVFAYVAWLTSHVFRALDVFPLVLAALGILMIAATVWVQRRFPALVARVDESRGARSGLPWSPVLSLLAPLIGLVMVAAAYAESDETRAQQEFRLRLSILQGHSHREQRARERAEERLRNPQAPRPPMAPVR